MPLPFQSVARGAISKTFTHGYAQSLVAGTHPQTLANQHRPGSLLLQRRTSKAGNSYLLQNAFRDANSPRTAVQETRPEKLQPALEAYYAAWDKTNPPGDVDPNEWKQHQFPKLIEWKPNAIEVDEEGSKNVEVSAAEADAAPKSAERADMTSVVGDIKNVQFGAEEAAALAKIDAAIEKEIKSREDQAVFEAELSVVAARVPTPPIAATQSPALSIDSTFQRTPTSSTTSVGSAADLQSQSYAEHLSKLAEGGRYAEIPAVFEAMLVGGIKPTAGAYNALLAAAVHLPADRTQIVSKALDVYSDMMRRKVSPNTAIYNTLINLIASHSIQVSSLKQAMEEKRVRFGGMEEAGKFMFASNEIEFAILAEDDRLDLALRLFDASTAVIKDRSYPAVTYHQLISACSAAGRVPDMVRLYEHMETSRVVPLAATFPPMIRGFTASGDLVSAVECYNKYKQYAVDADAGKTAVEDRADAHIYAALMRAYVNSGKLDGAMKFYSKVSEGYGDNFLEVKDVLIGDGLIQGLIEQNMLGQALSWAEGLGQSTKSAVMSKIAVLAADKDDKAVAAAAFAQISHSYDDIAKPVIALLALSVRSADVAAASRYWSILSHPDMVVTSLFIEPTAMYAVALIGSGQVFEGLAQSEQMFARIKSTVVDPTSHLADEVEEGIEFVTKFMNTQGIIDPRSLSQGPAAFGIMPAPAAYSTQPAFDDSFDPYANSTDFKGSALISDELERNGGRAKVSRLNEAMGRFRNIRRAGRHPRYVTYAKLISAAAREERGPLVHEILAMARSDVPYQDYPVVRYGWVSILDAMVGACLTLGNRALAEQHHQELRQMNAAPTANTFGLYITTLKESTKTFDEASEAVMIFHRAQAEGVEPSSFLYNALIGKLGKARRIDDCLFYFGEMRALGIRPTSVTYGTIVNALCRVSDEKFAEELFEEMESMPNYKARPAPYNSMIQFYLNTKLDKSKALAYYERMKSRGIQPTNHTYKLLVDTHATLEPVNMAAAEAVLDVIRGTGQKPEAVHYSSLIHAKGCVLHDMEGARSVFDSVMADSSVRPQACLYQALFESMVANHRVADTEPVLRDMTARRVDMTPYIANTLIHGWASEMNIEKSKKIFAAVGRDRREPSTYEAMTRAYLAVQDKPSAQGVVQEMLSRGYPHAVSNKILELLNGAHTESL